AAARRLHDLGAQIVAISTADGSVHEPDGLDVPSWLDACEEVGDAGVAKAPAHQRIPRGSELLVDCDVLIPAAAQDVIDAQLAAEIRAELLVEGANLPTTPEAREVLADRGVTVVPDFIANAGGAIAAGFAMDARYSPFPPDPEEILRTVAAKTRDNTNAVLQLAQQRGVSSHQAALELAQERVRTAMALRGRLPAGV